MIDLEAMSPADAAFVRRHFSAEIGKPGTIGGHVDAQLIAEGRDYYGRTIPKPKGPSEPEREFLKALPSANELMSYTHQPTPLPLDGNTTYQPDFMLSCWDGRIIYVETKGRRMTSESLTRMKLRQCSQKWPNLTWWLARWSPRLPWKVQEVKGGVISRKLIVVEWLT